MKESLLRSLSQFTFNLLPNLHPKVNPHRIPPNPLSSSSRLFSSNTSDPSESNLGQSKCKDEDISDEELREQLNNIHEGDEEAFGEAFPTVFRAMLSRLLEGKSTEEISKEFSILRRKDEEESASD